MQGMMIQGTASDVGKSIVQTSICRYFANQDLRVAPFKSQNMTNYLREVSEGKYISRAQALQAEAAKVKPHTAMNPIILRIVQAQNAEVFLSGLSQKVVSGSDYRKHFYEKGLQAIQEALHYIEQHYDIIIAEGAGSPVEINLKNKELVNMKIAELADLPVVLVSDIDRGGVFASIIGTLNLMTDAERSRVKGLIINKFQGDSRLFELGVNWLEEKTGLPVLGVLPYIAHHIEPEDSFSKKDQQFIPSPSPADKYEDLLDKFKGHLDFQALEKIMKMWGRS